MQSHAIRAEFGRLVSAAAAAKAAEQQVLRAARVAELERSGRERFGGLLRVILLFKRALADGQARHIHTPRLFAVPRPGGSFLVGRLCERG